MELKPSRQKQRLDGFGRPLARSDTKNPFASLARGVETPVGAKRRRFASDTLGATPPRDGPFALGAADVAAAKPPRTRARQGREPAALGALPPNQSLKPK